MSDEYYGGISEANLANILAQDGYDADMMDYIQRSLDASEGGVSYDPSQFLSEDLVNYQSDNPDYNPGEQSLEQLRQLVMGGSDPDAPQWIRREPTLAAPEEPTAEYYDDPVALRQAYEARMVAQEPAAEPPSAEAPPAASNLARDGYNRSNVRGTDLFSRTGMGRRPDEPGFLSDITEWLGKPNNQNLMKMIGGLGMSKLAYDDRRAQNDRLMAEFNRQRAKEDKRNAPRVPITAFAGVQNRATSPYVPGGLRAASKGGLV